MWYRIILTVTDSEGGTGKDSVDILPEKSTITIATNPPGLEVTVDGQPFLAPVVVTGVEGVRRTFGTQSTQTKDGVEYEFTSWSNGGELTQTFATPTDDLQLTANFSVVVGEILSSRGLRVFAGGDIKFFVFPEMHCPPVVNIGG